MLNGAATYSVVRDRTPFMRAATPAGLGSRHRLGATRPRARSLHGDQAGIILRGGGVVQVVLEEPERRRFLEARVAKEFQMAANFEAAGFVGPGRPIRLDEV